MRIHSMRHMFWAAFPFYLLLLLLPLLAFAIYFAHIFMLAAFCSASSFTFHMAAASPCLSLHPFYPAIRRASRMPLFLIRFFTFSLTAAATHTHTRRQSLTDTNTCIRAQLLWLCHSINENKMCVPDDDVPYESVRLTERV